MENGSRDSTKQSMVETATLVALVAHALYLVILAQCILCTYYALSQYYQMIEKATT